jgi:hypothetical protein
MIRGSPDLARFLRCLRMVFTSLSQRLVTLQSSLHLPLAFGGIVEMWGLRERIFAKSVTALLSLKQEPVTGVLRSFT